VRGERNNAFRRADVKRVGEKRFGKFRVTTNLPQLKIGKTYDLRVKCGGKDGPSGYDLCYLVPLETGRAANQEGGKNASSSEEKKGDTAQKKEKMTGGVLFRSTVNGPECPNK